MIEDILLSILEIYREELKLRVENIKDDSIKVVEFYMDKRKYYIDMDNHVYIRSNNKDRLTGIRVGYLNNGTIFLGGENTIKN